MNIYRRPALNKCLLFTGTTLTTIGLIILIHTTSIVDFIITSSMAVTPTSKAFQGWSKTMPLGFDIYFFNWTNPEDIYNANVKPKFQEVGPYKFTMVIERVNVSWGPNNSVSYENQKTFYVDPDSPRKLTDVITTINVVALGTAHAARDWGFFKKKAISMTLSLYSELHVTKTAGELLFDGYEDQILSAAGYLPFVEVADKFGLFYNRNATPTGGTYEMWTKTDENFGKILSWQEKQHTGFYEGRCGEVRGSAGGFFPINLERDKIEFFDSEMCKTLVFKYEKDVVVNGIDGYKFSGKNIFDNGTANPENSCFCNGECIPTGVLNVSSCTMDSPTFLSLPHFYNADPYYVNAVEGLQPDEEKHEFFFTLEPKTGIVIDTAAAMQMNMLLKPVEGIRIYENVPTIFFPIFYCIQRVTVGDGHAFGIKLLLFSPYTIGVSSLLMSLIGLILIFKACLILLRHKDATSQNSFNDTISSYVPEEEPLKT